MINYLPFLNWEQKGWLFDVMDQLMMHGFFS